MALKRFRAVVPDLANYFGGHICFIVLCIADIKHFLHGLLLLFENSVTVPSFCICKTGIVLVLPGFRKAYHPCSFVTVKNE